jgi:hypothetical protein
VWQAWRELDSVVRSREIFPAAVSRRLAQEREEENSPRHYFADMPHKRIPFMQYVQIASIFALPAYFRLVLHYSFGRSSAVCGEYGCWGVCVLCVHMLPLAPLRYVDEVRWSPQQPVVIRSLHGVPRSADRHAAGEGPGVGRERVPFSISILLRPRRLGTLLRAACIACAF